MTTDRRLERLPDLLAELYLGSTPDYRDDVLERAGRTRQRPAWTFPERWLPVDFAARRRLPIPNLPWRTLGIVALIATLLGALLAAYAGSRRLLPAPFGPARNGAIVYAKDGDIYVRDSAGAAPRLLIGGTATDQGPTFSRQGDRFMFFRVVSDTDTCECEVWLANADGSDPHKIAGPFKNPNTWNWSPDGSKLVIGYDDDAGRAVLGLVPTDGRPATVLNVGMPATWAEWRPPNGDQLVFRGGDPNGDGKMYLVKPDGTGLTQLDLPIAGIGGQHDFGHGYSWSPDGHRFAYEAVEKFDMAKVGVTDGIRIHVADIDPAGKVISTRRLEFDPTADNELQPIWLPSGDRIVFQSREGNADYLSVGTVPIVSATGGETATRVGPSTASGGGIGYEISPDGHSLLVLFWNERTTFSYDLDARTFAVADLGPLDVSSYQRLAP